VKAAGEAALRAASAEVRSAPGGGAALAAAAAAAIALDGFAAWELCLHAVMAADVDSERILAALRHLSKVHLKSGIGAS
jgi:hypothetical protein